MSMPRRRMPGFTIIELLTVVAVIAVLISLLLPAIANARGQAKTVKCSSNLRQMGIALQMYANDWNDVIMPIGDSDTSKRNPSNPYYDPNLVAPYWYEVERASFEYFRFAAKSKSGNADILRCPIAVEQLVPISNTWGKYQTKYALNFNICPRKAPFRKFGSLQRVTILSADGYAEYSGGTYGIWEGINKDWKPWPFVYPYLMGHNNAHYANLLFSDLHVEARKQNPTDKEWKDQ